MGPGELRLKWEKTLPVLLLCVLWISISVGQPQAGPSGGAGGGTRARNGNGNGGGANGAVGGADYDYNGYEYEEYNTDESDESKFCNGPPWGRRHGGCRLIVLCKGC